VDPRPKDILITARLVRERGGTCQKTITSSSGVVGISGRLRPVSMILDDFARWPDKLLKRLVATSRLHGWDRADRAAGLDLRQADLALVEAARRLRGSLEEHLPTGRGMRSAS